MPGSTSAATLEFEAFLCTMGDAIGSDLSGFDFDATLRDDLGWDSLDMLAALAVLDDHGVTLPEELPGELRTLGDLYHYLDVLAGSTSALAEPRDAFHGPNVWLLPVTAAHEDYIYKLCTAGTHLTHFRLRGMIPSPESFHRFIWDKSIAQFLVCTEQGPVGWVSAFDADYRNRNAHIAAVADPEFAATGFVAEGAALLVSYLFTQFDLRKVYAESIEVNFQQFSSGHRWMFAVEARLVDHEYLDGRYHDLITVAAHREAWRTVHRRLFHSEARF